MPFSQTNPVGEIRFFGISSVVTNWLGIYGDTWLKKCFLVFCQSTRHVRDSGCHLLKLTLWVGEIRLCGISHGKNMLSMGGFNPCANFPRIFTDLPHSGKIRTKLYPPKHWFIASSTYFQKSSKNSWTSPYPTGIQTYQQNYSILNTWSFTTIWTKSVRIHATSP